MELTLILVIGGIVAAYAYGCGNTFGGRLAGSLRRHFPRRKRPF